MMASSGTTSSAKESVSIIDVNKSPDGSKTPESLSGCHSPSSPGSPIKDDACPICLGSIADKCAAGSCLHYFCLVCLKEWSKQKAVCPLCKQTFTKILYEIKSETDYKEWVVPKRVVDPQSFASTLTEFLRTTERSFFGYRTTNATRSHLYLNPRRRRMVPYLLNRVALPSGPRDNSLVIRNQNRGSSTFRLSIYINNVWVQPLSDITGSYRESSPDLYREQPALTHRLVPWVNREVAALLISSRVSVVLVEILDLIERYPINSREFCIAMRPHFGSRTSHFVHEFYNFARSPYDMVGHDNAARYVSQFELDDAPVSDSEGEEDEIIEVESNGDPVQPLDLSARPAIEEVLANDGSVIISSGNSSSGEGEGAEYSSLFSATHNPDPPPDYIRYFRKSHFKSQKNNNQETNHLQEPGPSGISSSSSGKVNVKRESEENRNNSDECLVVDVLKPKKDRTPEIINLSSDSDCDRLKEKSLNKTHWKKKISKQVGIKSSSKISKKLKKQPRLDRNSFSLHFSGTVNCNHLGLRHTIPLRDDHNYCGSASNQNVSEIDSEQETERTQSSSGKSKILKKGIIRKRIRLATDSDSDREIRMKEKSVNSRLLIKGTRRAYHKNKQMNNESESDNIRSNILDYNKAIGKSKILSKGHSKYNSKKVIDGSISNNGKTGKLKNSTPILPKSNDDLLNVRRSSRLVNKHYLWDNYEFSSDEESDVSPIRLKGKTVCCSLKNSKSSKLKSLEKDNFKSKDVCISTKSIQKRHFLHKQKKNSSEKFFERLHRSENIRSRSSSSDSSSSAVSDSSTSSSSSSCSSSSSSSSSSSINSDINNSDSSNENSSSSVPSEKKYTKKHFHSSNSSMSDISVKGKKRKADKCKSSNRELVSRKKRNKREKKSKDRISARKVPTSKNKKYIKVDKL